MESDSSLGGDTAEMESPPELNEEDESRERVLGSDLESNLGALGQKKFEVGQIFDQIQEKASSVLDFSLKLKKDYASMEDLLKEVEKKEKAVMERVVVVEKKEERLMEREKKIELLEESLTVKEKENDMKHCVESFVMRLVFKMGMEEIMKKLEERGEEVERVSKLNDEKMCELERKVKEFDLKKLKSKEDEVVKESLKQLEMKQKEIDEAIKELNEVEKKDEIFESEEMGLKRRFLELREKKLEGREKELELKQRELQEGTERVEFRKRKGSEADSLISPAKKLKSQSHDDADKDKDLASVVVCVSTSSSEQIKEEHQEETDEDTKQIACVDSEFHDFNKTMSSFAVDEIWALHDPMDLMPRIYAKIKRIVESGLCLEVTRLESCDEESVPVGCGRFFCGNTETSESYLAFSHEMQPIIRDENFITLTPSIGETWALFTDWSRSWINKPPYRYDFVEVVRSFDDQEGVGVAYLGKVEGFVSVFERAAQHGIRSLMIKPEEMSRFSHKVPSFRLNGEEKKGVPAGSFELDPAAIPHSLLKLDHSICEEAEETGRQSKDRGEVGVVKDQDE